MTGGGQDDRRRADDTRGRDDRRESDDRHSPDGASTSDHRHLANDGHPSDVCHSSGDGDRPDHKDLPDDRRGPGRGLRIRTRLTLMYSLVFLAGGAVLLTIQYFAVDRILGDKRAAVTTAPYAVFPAGTVFAPVTPADPAGPVAPAVPLPSDAVPASPLPGTDATSGSMSSLTLAEAAEDGFVSFKTLVLNALVGQSLLALAALVLIAAALGWWMAGRSLARLHTVTATARRISERNLDDRLALLGPEDEIKELADTFDAMLARLDRAFAANRRFAANASHELRTPLALQRASLEIPLAEGRVPDDLRPSIERSLRATARSERLVGSLLLLAKGQQGPESYAHSDLAALADEAVDMYRAEAAAAGVVITTELDRAPTSGDPVLLEQVAANLVQNAVRHNAPDAEGRSRITVTTGRAGDEAELRVVNSGPAVDPADVDELFEPFHRGTAARLAGTKAGSGLGLSIVRAVVDSHGGRVEAEPRSEGGLAVTVRLPVA
ncbi:HAMP domain-containing sensor histidine kinase [Yinghuangia sp. YIM S09857]|uniref:HAMP domain-containing sensor histidine kinase n=1 Tax=Yinghuangia sp. YIM S09857 TaxID=3436929 RepID=UPI003F5332F3